MNEREETVEEIAARKYPFRHWGVEASWPATENCPCDECCITSGKQYAYEEGFRDALEDARSALVESELVGVIHKAACGDACSDSAPMRIDYKIARGVSKFVKEVLGA